MNVGLTIKNLTSRGTSGSSSPLFKRPAELTLLRFALETGWFGSGQPVDRHRCSALAGTPWLTTAFVEGITWSLVRPLARDFAVVLAWGADRSRKPSRKRVVRTSEMRR